jgi:hypothetical protein
MKSRIEIPRIVYNVIKALLFLFVALYIYFPNVIDRRYGTLAGLAVIALIISIAFDFPALLKRMKDKEGLRKPD